jgi:hypothetical protein
MNCSHNLRADKLHTRSSYLRSLVALTMILYAGHPVRMAGQTAPQTPATSAQPAEAAELQSLLDQHRYIEFSDKLVATIPSHLTGSQTLYFSGMLAFSLGQLDNAAPRLIRAVNNNKDHSLTPTQVEEALETLGQINLKLTFYSGAAKVEGMLYQTLGTNPGPGGQAILDRRHLAELLAKVPPQTVELAEDFTLSAASTLSPVTSAEYAVSIPGQPAPAKPLLTRFDTGAEISLLSASTAKAWGVTMLEGSATLLGAGGSTFLAQPGFLPALMIGKAHFHNVAVYVTADENLYFAPLKLQLNATLGYTVLHALGRLNFRQDGSLHVEAKSPERDPNSTTLWLANHFLLIELATRPVFKGKTLVDEADDQLFVLDTGSFSTVLTDRYLAEHKDLFNGQTPKTGTLGGADGAHDLLAYGVHNLPLFANASGVLVLDGQHVLAQPMVGPGEDYFGIIGQDVLSRLPGYTIDFRTMTFAVLHNTVQ